MGSEDPIVYFIEGKFLVFEPRHALTLRKRRILSHSVGPSGGPFSLTHEQALEVYKHHLATFKILKQFQHVSLDANRSRFLEIQSELIDKEKERFISHRTDELRKRNIPVNSKTMKEFDVTKFRLEISNTPDQKVPALESVILSDSELEKLFSNSDDPLMIIFHDLYTRGLYVSSGLKFGSDFLAYQGDPVRYHALYAVRYVESNSDGSVDLTKMSYNEVNSFQRLTHGANKIPLFATIHEPPPYKVNYWTLENRVYLDAGSDSSIFDSIEPTLANTNKHQRTM